ncbi:hypothetical protein ACQ4PT_057265 [Festuca glaucescens]
MEGRVEDAGRSAPAASTTPNLGSKPVVMDGGGGTCSAAPSERVEQMMAKLRITAVESTVVVVDDTEDLDLVDPDRAFVGKVLAPNKHHVQTIASALRPAWGNPKGLTFNPAGDNLFVAEFGSKADRDRVMEGSPWTVGRNAVLMKKYDVDVQPQMVVFDCFAIWARILALPNRLMNSQLGLEIAKPIGLVKKVECDDRGRCWGTFMRLRVEVKVDEPLLRVVTVFSSKLQAAEIFAVQYERLPIYCFSCGLIGHSTLVCSTLAERDENDELPYSAKKLSAPDEHKKSGGSWSGNASAGGAHSASGSKNSTARSVFAGRGRPKARQHQQDEQEVSSPSKGGRGNGRGGGCGSRGRGRSGASASERGRELFPANSAGKSSSSLKRKASKTQAGQPPALTIEKMNVDNSRALVLSEQSKVSLEVDDDNLSSDSYKKQRDRSAAQIELFWQCMDDCSLSDLDFSGPKFTWCNRQDAQSNVRVRLDRAMCNTRFATWFADCFVENVITTSSDHYAIALCFDSQPGQPSRVPV